MERKNQSTFTPSLLGSCLGVIVSFALIALVIVLSVTFSSTGKTSYYKKNSVLHLTLEGVVPEKTGNQTDDGFVFGAKEDAIGLQRIVELIRHAATDDKIKGIYLENNNISMGQSSLYTIIQELNEFKKSGKFIYSYANAHSQSSYFLCSVADSMFLNPQGLVDLRGFGSMVPFFKGTMDKLGIKMEVFYAGDFKSASEPFRSEKMSDENRLQIKEFLYDMKALMAKTLEENRKINAVELDSIMNQFAGRSAKSALSHKLVDVLMQKSDFEAFLKTKLGVEEKKELSLISLGKYRDVVEIEEKKGKEKIAIVYAEGEISFGDDAKGVITKNKYSKIFSKILEDEKVKAVVLRVNSPGGDAFTSEVIWDYVQKLKAKNIPVVASFGDYAASGGYYIACGADYIVAQPNTLTGSIGVFTMFPNVKTLTQDKLGLRFDTVKTNDLSIALSPFQELSEKEKVLMQESVLDIYDLFLDRVSKGRNLSLDSTKMIARGRVWTGKRAVDLGLVDELGNLDFAINKAKEMAKLDKYSVTEYPSVKVDFLSEIMRELNKSQEEEVINIFVSEEEKAAFNFIRESRKILDTKRVQARLPFIPYFN